MSPTLMSPASPAAAAPATPATVPAYGLIVFTTTACNLGCGYCYQNTGPDRRGGSQPPRIDSVALGRRTAAQVLDFAAGRMAASGFAELDLQLSGGEPLLNPAGCRDLLEFAADRGLRSAQLVSNGTLLTPTLARELADLGLDSVQVTFDGRRAEHDQVRVRRSGGAGTFDTILTRMARASEVTALRWEVRINVARHNLATADELPGELARRLDPARCRLSFHPVADAGVGYRGALAADAALADLFARWTVEAAELGFRPHRPVAGLPCRYCSVHDGRFGAVVSADGALYSCPETAGRAGWAVGTVREGYWPEPEVASRWVGCARHGGLPAGAGDFQDAVAARVHARLRTAGRLDLLTADEPPAGPAPR